MSYLQSLIKETKNGRDTFEYDGYLVIADDASDLYFVYREFDDEHNTFDEPVILTEEELYDYFDEEENYIFIFDEQIGTLFACSVSYFLDV